MQENAKPVGLNPGVPSALHLVAFTSLMLCIASCASAQTGTKSAASGKQRHFETPEAAVEALFVALDSEDRGAVIEIFGPDHEKLVAGTTEIDRQEAVREIIQAAQEMKKLEEETQDKRILIIGNKSWPFPIPIVRVSAGWHFDTAAGLEEIIDRRVGENELDVIAICRAYVVAQMEFASIDRDGDDVLEYAQRLRSTEGKHDGLYWDADPDKGEEMSPFGPMLADAADFLAASEKTKMPFHGYYFKVLTGQGSNPPGGRYDYVINGNMIAGFALVACPAVHGSSGVMTFVVSHHGKVYEKDLGEKTLEIGKKMNEFDPDESWQLVDAD